MSTVFQKGVELPWQDLGGGVHRKIYGHGPRLMLVLFKFEKGGVGAPHSHPHEQSSYVQSGVFELTIGDEKKVLYEGDGYYVPPNTIHSCLCLESGVLVDAFSPAREEFL